MKQKFIIFSLCFGMLFSCRKDMKSVRETSRSETSVMIGDTIIHRFVINGNPTYVNEVKGKYYFAGDLTINRRQFNSLKRLSNNNLSTSERSTIISSFSNTWPGGIVYFEIKGGNKHYVNLRRAMDEISLHSPIKFVWRDHDEKGYIRFEDSDHNSAPLGRGDDEPSTIELKNWDRGIIIHEIMHVLGVHHEQCRPDRGLFLRVYDDRVKSGEEINFNIAIGFSGYGRFDYGSIMTYDSYSFSRDPGLPTMTKFDGTTFSMQRDSLSEGDYEGLNHLYNPINTKNLKEGVYRIVTVLNIDKCVSVPQNKAILRIYLRRKYQQFILRKSDIHGYFILKPMSDTSKVLTVEGQGRSKPGAAVELQEFAGKDSQKWRLSNLGNDGFSFQPRSNSGLLMEVKDGLDDKETPIVVGKQSKSIPDKQRFKLFLVL